MGVISAARPYLPGIAFLAVGAILSHLIAGAVDGLQPLVVAVGIGALVGNTAGTPDAAEPGVGVDKLFLRPESSCSARRSSSKSSSPRGRPCSGSSSSRSAADSCSRRRSLGVCSGSTGRRPRFLRARVSAASPRSSRSGACSTRGGSAITFAAATVLLFDAVTLVAFPIAGEWLGLTGRQFGVWAGVSMFSTGPVAAAGFAHSTEAGQWATVTKLARNSLLASRSPTRSRTPRAVGDRARRAAAVGGVPEVPARVPRGRGGREQRAPLAAARWSRSDGCRTRSSRWRSSASGSRSGSGRCARSAGPPSARSRRPPLVVSARCARGGAVAAVAPFHSL